jgi:hypothetical protein
MFYDQPLETGRAGGEALVLPDMPLWIDHRQLSGGFYTTEPIMPALMFLG